MFRIPDSPLFGEEDPRLRLRHIEAVADLPCRQVDTVNGIRQFPD